MQKQKEKVLNGDGFDNVPYSAKQPFRHFTRKRLPFRGAFFKLPLFERAIICRFRKNPEGAREYYGRKNADPETLRAIGFATRKYHESMGRMGRVFGESIAAQTEAIGMLGEMHKSALRQIEHAENLGPDYFDYRRTEEVDKLVDYAKRIEVQMREAEKLLALFEKDGPAHASSNAIGAAVWLLKKTLAEAGRKNRLG